MKKKIAAALLALAALCAAVPANAFAADQTVDAGDGSCEVTASTTVTDGELKELGLNVVVSFPAEVALTLIQISRIKRAHAEPFTERREDNAETVESGNSVTASGM